MATLDKVQPGLNQNTVRGWVRRLRRDGSAVSLINNSGRIPSLSIEEVRLLVGHILHVTNDGKPVTMTDASDFLFKHFGKTVVDNTIRNRFKEYGISSKHAKLKANNAPPLHVQIEMYKKFILALREKGYHKLKILSLDFTFTSHRTTRPTTYGPTGQKVRVVVETPRFTNCIITAVLSDGTKLPCYVYTFNPKFRTDRNPTEIRRADLNTYLAALERFGIIDDQVCYEGNEYGNESRTYVAESSAIVLDFLQQIKHLLPDEAYIICSDNGSAFKDGNKSVIDKMKLENLKEHVFYPAAVHQYLSPNDNNLHGAAKGKWRAGATGFKDDVERTLELMSHLQNVKDTDVKKWFDRNLFLDGRKVTDEAVKEIIHGPRSQWSDLHAECLEEYRFWAQVGSASLVSQKKKLESDLDGTHWMSKN